MQEVFDGLQEAIAYWKMNLPQLSTAQQINGPSSGPKVKYMR